MVSANQQFKLFLITFYSFLTLISIGQTTEDWEDESVGSSTFTSNSQSFSITGTNTFDVFQFTNGGWNGSSTDNKFIDNTSSTTPHGDGARISIVTSDGSDFSALEIYLFLANNSLGTGTGTVTISGFIDGSATPEYSFTKSSGFSSVTTFSPNNGFTKFDFATDGASDYSGTSIDSLVIVTTNTFDYVAIDGFKWDVAASCSMTASITSQTNVGCNGESTGALTVTQSSGTSNFDYSWSNGATTSNSGSSTNAISSLAAGTYTVTVTDDNACTATASATVTQPASALVASASVSTALDCNGDTDGQMLGSASGGTTPYTYSWNTGGTSATETGLGAATYSVTITDQNGCTDSASGTLTEPTALVASASVSTALDCNGDTDGAMSASPSGGTSPYTYSWNTGGTSQTETNIGAGTYSVTITDQNGCTDSASGTLTQPTALVASAAVSSSLDCNGDTDGQVTASQTGGTAGYTYNWNTGETNATETNLGAGTYSVTITDANGCTDSGSTTLTEPSALVASASVASAIDCNGDTDGQMLGSASGGTTPYTYSWNTGGTSATETGLGAATYSVTITDQNGCTDSASGTLTEPTALVASASVSTALDCNGDTDGQMLGSASGGTTPYTYSWNTGGTSATETGLGAATYSVTITDQNGCTDSASGTLTEPSALVASAAVTSTLDCNGDTDGQVTASQTGGSAGYTYNWNTGETNATETNLGAGTYSVTITDANGCTDSGSTTLTEPSALVASAAVTSALDCNGDTDGQVTASQTGGTAGYTYNWNTGETNATETNLGAGTYSVTITDANGCTDSGSTTLTEPSALVASASVASAIDCNGDTDGQMLGSASGGTTPYTYSWNTGGTSATETGLGAGTYSVTITDQNGCTDSASGTLTEPTALVANSVVDSNSTCGASDGGATAGASGGTSPYTYLWSNTATTASITGITAGTYSVTITDNNGCTDSASSTITTNPGVTASSVVDSNATCNGLSDGGATASGSGGATPYTYLWSNTATTASITGVAAGTYSVTITDNNGCTDSGSSTITEPASLVAATVVDSNASCNGLSDGGMTASASGGTAAYTYSWSNGATTASITGVAAGTYSVTITDANGCTDSASGTVTEPATLVAASVVDSNASCNGLSDGGATASATGGTMPYSYLWSNTATTASITGVAAGTYSVTITDNNGCTDSGSSTITEPASLVAATVVDSNASCNGLSDGGATASATGGTMPYSYLWSNTATTASITGVSAGTYSVTITDNNGCTDSGSSTITEPASLVAASVVDSNASCNGLSDGGATASATGGTMPYNYLWSNTATTASITGVAAGTYSVTITDNNGCTDSGSSTITEPASLVAATVVDSNASCNGLSDGGMTASASGGTSAYTYSWSNGATTASITGVAAGTYSVTITDANGCTDSASGTVTEPATLVAASVVDSNASCNGLSDGGATASATGGTMPYSYLWSNTATTASITSVAAGTYSVTITDNNGCTDSGSSTITEPASLVAATVVDSNASCNGLSDGGATASATGGTMPYSYLWSNTATTASITGVAAGTYSVTITDNNGCTDSGSSTITEPASLVAASVVDSNVSCNGLSDGGATASATGGTMPYNYLWSNTATTASITGVAAGTYSVTITDNNGCTDSASGTITEPVTTDVGFVFAVNASCNGVADGSIVSFGNGGTMPYTYAWSNGATTASINGIAAGTYSVTVTDNNGCTDSASYTITEPASLAASSTLDSNVTCNGLSDGGMTASATGGTSAYTYSWSNGATTASITGVSAGTYSVTITDANGCTDSASGTVTEPATLVAASIVDSNVSCNGLSDGGKTASASGGTAPYTYAWSNGATTASITGVSAGTYSVTITDANGCTDSASGTVTEPASLVAASVVDSTVSCYLGSDGGATASATGGTMPYNYLWSNTATTASITGVVAGTYSVTITDANGCTDSSSEVISEPTLLIAGTSLNNNVSCNGGSDGAVSAFALQGTSPYTFSWSNGTNIALNNGLSAGTYTVTVTDNNGCTSSSVISVSEPTQLVAASVVDSNVTCNGLSDGGMTASASGGTSAYTYSWSNGATTASITGVAAGTYSVTITDANGCTDSASGTVTEPATLVAVSVVDSNASCNGLSDGGATASATGGTMPYSYLWSNTATTASITGVAAGTYSVTITDNNGCTDSGSSTITEPASLVAASVVDSNASCNGLSDGGATASATGGTMPYSYLWSNTATTASITGVAAGTYSVTITDNNGCTDSGSSTITEPASLVAATVVDSNASCNGLSDGGATASATGGTMPYSYLWSNTATTASITGVAAGTYTVTITDNNGCTSTSSSTITEPASLVAASVVDSNVTCNGLSDGGMTASASGGTSAYTYSWSNGATTASITGVTAGTYSVTITDANGCTDSASGTVTEPATLVAALVVDSNVSCNGLSDGGATASATGGTMPYSYLWSNTATTASITGVSAGTYSVTITDNNGCTDSGSSTITEPASLVAASVVDSNISCNGLSDGGATASATGGTMPYSYLWSNTATTASITGVAAGTYTVTITDNNGCTSTSSSTITEPATLVAASVVDSSVTCNGLSDGGATASATGGTMPYNYLWSNTATTASITGVSAGTYTVTITDNNGCTSTSSSTVTEPATLIAATVADSMISCNGLSDGGATASATGGTMPYNYLWSNTATTASITGVTAGTYSVTVTDNNGCTNQTSVTITQPATLFTQTNVASTINCYGGNDGQITSTTSGGTTPYSYNWSTGAATSGISNVSVGAYTVTVTDANGCTLTRTQTIAQPDSLSSTFASTSDVSCNGNNDGAIDLSVTGGTSPYTFNWSNSATTEDLATITAGTYTVTITDANGCTLVKSTMISEPDALASDNISVDNVSCNGGNDGSIVIDFIGGTEPYNYLWSTGSIATSATGLSAGTYTVTVTDDNGCTISVSETITEPTLLTASASLGNDVSCNAGTDGSASATSTGGTTPVTYAWSNGATGEDLTGVAAGTYTVTVTDNNGCTATDVVSISEPSAISASVAIDSNVTCNSLSNGGLTVSATGGTGNLSFTWSNGANTAEITGLAAGTYTVTITDDNSCTEVLSEVITEPATLTANAAVDSNVTCATFSDGGATVSANGGTAPYSYVWTNSATTASITGVTANTYTVTVTDNNGCSTTTNVTIGEPNPLLVNIDTDSIVTCNGLANGGVTARASAGTAPYNFAWSTGETSASITQLAAGTYSVTITDANGCVISDEITMTEPTVVSATAVVDSTVKCNGLADGGATVTANGGTAPYTYDWSNGDNTSTISGLVAGVYTVEVTDANGCTDEASISISQPSALNMTTAIEDAIDCYGFTGEISASADGGTRPYNYNWNNGATAIINSNIDAGSYTVTVTDANGCSLVRTQNITQPDSLMLTAVIEPENFQGDGRIDLTVTGGTGTYNYDWDNDQAGDFDDNQDLNTLPTGDYQVIVEDVNGCRDTATYFVPTNVSTLPILEGDAINVFPTPTAGVLNIEHDGLTINQIFIYSMEGRIVYQSNTSQNQIDISNLERATYFMEIHTDKGVVQKRIIRR